MQDITNALYFHAQEKQVPRYLQTPEYHQAVTGLEESWEAFRADLTKEQSRTLDRLLGQEGKIWRLENGAAFCAGISIGLDLGRL